jgi:hypothetical protein
MESEKTTDEMNKIEEDTIDSLSILQEDDLDSEVGKSEMIDVELGKSERQVKIVEMKDVSLSEGGADTLSVGPSWHYGPRRTVHTRNSDEMRMLRCNSVTMFCIMCTLICVPLLVLLRFFIMREM